MSSCAGLTPAAAAIGLAGSTGATRMLRAMLFEIDALDVSTLAGAALVVVAVSAASYIPMRRASRLDAVATLRN